MKRKIVLCAIIFILLVSTQWGLFYLQKQEKVENKKINDDFHFIVEKKTNCVNEQTKYYEYEDRTVIFVCLNEVYLEDTEENKVTLKEYFQNKEQTFEEKVNNLTAKLNLAEGFYDGGTTRWTNGVISIIKCNKNFEIKDIYIGDSSLRKEREYCVEKFSAKKD